MPHVTDLSADATANCCIVSSAGSYSFKTVNGNSTKSVVDVVIASVLWESFGTDVKPDVGGEILCPLCSGVKVRTFRNKNDYEI